jgi:hypothetical protein
LNTDRSSHTATPVPPAQTQKNPAKTASGTPVPINRLQSMFEAQHEQRSQPSALGDSETDPSKSTALEHAKWLNPFLPVALA